METNDQTNNDAQVINNDQAIAELTGKGQPPETPGTTGEPVDTEIKPTETPSGGTPQEGQTQAQEPTQTQLDIEDTNTFIEKLTEGKFKSAEDFKNHYTDIKGRWDQYKDLEKVKKELNEGKEAFETHKQEIENLYQEANPEKIFGSMDAYKNYLIKQEIVKDGTKDGAIVDVVLNSNIDEMDDVALVLHQKQLNTPGLDGEEALYDLIINDLGKKMEDLQDEEGNDLQIDNKADLYKILKPHEMGRLRIKANEAKKELLSIKNTDVQADNNYFTSFQAKREAENKAKEDRINQLKESWKPVYDSFHDIKSVQLFDKDKEGNEKVIFDFPIDGGVLSKINKIVEDYVISHNIEPNDENIQQVRSEFINGYAQKNWGKMVRTALTQSVEQVNEDNMRERDNQQPMNTTMNTEQGAPDISKKNIEKLRAEGII